MHFSEIYLNIVESNGTIFYYTGNNWSDNLVDGKLYADYMTAIQISIFLQKECSDYMKGDYRIIPLQIALKDYISIPSTICWEDELFKNGNGISTTNNPLN